MNGKNKARQGDFEPSQECGSYKSKRLTKQIRRISSLRKRMEKLSQTSELWTRTVIGLHQEWNAINNWYFDGMLFSQWAAYVPELMPVPVDLPRVPWLFDAEQILRHELQRVLHHESRIQRKKLEMRHVIECQDNHKKNLYAALRRHEFRPFQHLEKQIEELALIVPNDEPNQFDVFVHNPNKFTLFAPIQVDGKCAKLTKICDHYLVVAMTQDLPPHQEEVTIVQSYCSFHQSEVFAELDAFWQPYWTRQDESDGLDFQNHFVVPSVQFPAMDDAFETSLSEWKEALVTCNNSSSIHLPRTENVA